MSTPVPTKTTHDNVQAVFDLVLLIAEVLVDRPDEIILAQDMSDDSVYLTLRVHPSDLKNIMGAKGKVLHALRQLLKSISTRTECPFILVFGEPQEAEGMPN